MINITSKSAGLQWLALFFLLCSVAGCRLFQMPHRSFAQVSHPAPPDYSNFNNWATLPFKHDPADSVPQGHGLENQQTTAPVDVFFIHPTTFRKSHWNAPVSNVKINADTDERAILHQASVFNGTARVFAPRYRQMTYYGFFTRDTVSKNQAISLAYGDVKQAFEYYLEHWNDGRPFIIAGHSQGGLHGMNLLKDIAHQRGLIDQLVVAYLPGWKIPESFAKVVPVCENPEATGCFTTWSSYAADKKLKNRSIDYYHDAVCVNPISWHTDTAVTPRSAHEGTLMGNYREIRDTVVQAQCKDGVLRVTTHKFPFPYRWATNLHVADINLFWLNLRNNVAVRYKHFAQ